MFSFAYAQLMLIVNLAMFNHYYQLDKTWLFSNMELGTWSHGVVHPVFLHPKGWFTERPSRTFQYNHMRWDGVSLAD